MCFLSLHLDCLLIEEWISLFIELLIKDMHEFLPFCRFCKYLVLFFCSFLAYLWFFSEDLRMCSEVIWTDSFKILHVLVCSQNSGYNLITMSTISLLCKLNWHFCIIKDWNYEPHICLKYNYFGSKTLLNILVLFFHLAIFLWLLTVDISFLKSIFIKIYHSNSSLCISGIMQIHILPWQLKN